MSHTAEQIRSTIDRIMVEEFEAEPEALCLEARLKEDLDLDSLDGVDLVVALEKAFGCRISEDEAKGIVTLGDVCDRVRGGLERLAS